MCSDPWYHLSDLLLPFSMVELIISGCLIARLGSRSEEAPSGGPEGCSSFLVGQVEMHSHIQRSYQQTHPCKAPGAAGWGCVG